MREACQQSIRIGPNPLLQPQPKRPQRLGVVPLIRDSISLKVGTEVPGNEQDRK